MMRKGFTFPEVIIAVAFFAILLGLTTINLLGSRKQIAQGANVDVLVADIKNQQANAMSSKGTSPSDYGIYLEAQKYTLFIGDNYIPGTSTNFSVDIDPSVTINNIAFANSTIVFKNGSGEVLNFINGQNTFKLGVKTISINKIGGVNIQ